jgi:hypothetical protein
MLVGGWGGLAGRGGEGGSVCVCVCVVSKYMLLALLFIKTSNFFSFTSLVYL